MNRNWSRNAKKVIVILGLGLPAGHTWAASGSMKPQALAQAEGIEAGQAGAVYDKAIVRNTSAVPVPASRDGEESALGAGGAAGSRPALLRRDVPAPRGVKTDAGTGAAVGFGAGFVGGFLAVLSPAIAASAVPIVGKLIGGILAVVLIVPALLVGAVTGIIGALIGAGVGKVAG